MPVPQRDLELTAKQLIEWFAGRLPRAEKLQLSALRGPSDTGYSSDTLMFDLSWRENGEDRQEALVARLEPTGERVFPHYDLDEQFRVMQSLSDSNVPVPRMRWQEPDVSVLGVPFYIMEWVEGQIPPDTPTYHADGWLTKLDPEARASIWWSGLDVLARIHRVDWKSLDLGLAGQDQSDRSQVERQLDDYERYLTWAARGTALPISEAALDWLRRNLPQQPEPVALCWGDSRLGNMIFRDNSCVAVLDWEMVTLGNPDQDLAWWLFFDRHHSEGVGTERLTGFPSREESVARYEEWSGHRVQHLHYYEVFAAFRFSIIMVRVAQQLMHHGLLPEDSEFPTENTCTRILTELLEAA